ncbi:MAG: DEAD/DEAH box helicase [Cellvibrionales bacterium]|nr:DEAD/DEAH box helicase [Cellvibrionales bacterium]
MIIKWLKGKKADPSQESGKKTKASEGKQSPSCKKKPSAAKSPPSKKTKSRKNHRPTWDINTFDVPRVEGKTRFHDLAIHIELMQAIHKSGFDYCTPIQAETLPHTLKGQDVIGKAQTGTGKTAAFLITVMDQLLCHPLESKRYLSEPRALIIAPTRELVKQIEEDAKKLGQFSELSIVSLVGGEKFEKQENQLQRGFVDIVVATPGRLIDFVQQKKIYLDRVEILVLDEADRMLDMGFIPQVKQIVRATPHKENRQTLLFSATFDQDIINLSKQWTIDAYQIEVEAETVTTDNVEQISYMVADSDKVGMIARLTREDDVKHCIIFTNRKDQSQTLYDKLIGLGCKVGILTGDIQQSKRTQTLKQFKEGKVKVLIATDVVGRGIHIDGITHVINYNLPQEPENYVHRIGRTGRAGAKGVAINLIGEEDTYDVETLESYLGYKLDLKLPPEHLL